MADPTPGPWSVIGFEDLPDVDDLMIVAFDVAAPGERPPELYICNIGSDGGRYSAFAPVEAGPQWPASLANARLIAAAPDLLAACKAIELHIASDHPVTDNEHPYLTAVRQLRAAIAKAEGGTACLTA